MPLVNRERIFVNRDGPLRIIEEAAAAIPSDRAVIHVFHGPGGEGKTVLMQEVRRRLRQRDHLVIITLSFETLEISDPARLAVALRNLLKQELGWGTALAAFDIALVAAWQRLFPGERLPPLVHSAVATTPEAFGTAAGEGAAVALESIPGIGPLVSRGGGWLLRKGMETWVQRRSDALQTFLKLLEDSSPRQLQMGIADLLVNEANAWLHANPDRRIVLLVDEYENVLPHAVASGAPHGLNPLDEALRHFIAHADGLLALFFMRGKLCWDHPPELAAACRNQHALNGLNEQDARHWLQQVGITDAAIQDAMMQGARESNQPDAPVFPLLLQLQIDRYRNLSAPRPEDFAIEAPDAPARLRQLTNRLLDDYRDEPGLQRTLQRAGLLRRFTRQELAHACEGLAVDDDVFERIARMPFIRSETEHGEQILIMHRALAEVLATVMDASERHRIAQRMFDYFDARARVERFRQVTDASVAALMQAARFLHLLALKEEKTDLRGSQPFEEKKPASTPCLDIGFWLEKHHADNLWHAGRFAELAELWRLAEDVYRRKGKHRNRSVSLNKLGNIAMAQGDLAKAKRLFAESLKIRRRLVDEMDAPSNHRDLAIALGVFGDIVRKQGKLQKAKYFLVESLKIFRQLRENANSPKSIRDLSISLNKVGDILVELGNWHDAKDYFKESMKVIKHIDKKCASPETFRGISSILVRLGDIELAQYNLTEAKENFTKSLEIWRNLVNELGTPDSRRDLSVLLSRLGDIAVVEGNLNEAKQLLAESLEIDRYLVNELGTPDSRRDLSVSLEKLGDIAMAQGELAEAESLFAESMEIGRHLVDEQDTPGSHRDLSASLDRLGDIAMAQGDLAEAKRLFAESMEIRQRLVDELGTPDSRRGFSVSLERLGDIAMVQGDLAEAKRLFAESMEIRQRLVDELGTPDSRRDLSVSLGKLGNVLLHLAVRKKAAAADEAADKALQHWRAMKTTAAWWHEQSAAMRALPVLEGPAYEELLTQAEARFHEALQIRESLLARKGTPKLHCDMAIGWLHLAQVARARRDEAMLCHQLSEALPHAREHATIGTPDAKGLLWLVQHLLQKFACR